MKKLVIYLLCFIMLFQSCIDGYAAEADELMLNETVQEEVAEPFPEVPEEETEDVTDAEEPEETEETEAVTDPEVTEAEADPEKPEEEAENVTDAEEPEEETEAVTIPEEPEDAEDVLESQNEEEDPQYGRENGYLEEGFYEAQAFFAQSGYIHADRFSDHVIHDVIDVSKYQGTIDWAKVKKSGIDYAFIRVGFRGYGQSGSLNIDSKFKENIQNASASGIKVGVYFFSQAITEAEAREEAEYVISRIRDYKISLPVVIDFEYASSGSGLTGRLYHANLSKKEATKICRRFCETVEDNGYTAMVYANRNMLENGINASELSEDYKIWLANYSTSTSYAGEYEFWQYTSNGTVNGISGKVDKSFWYEEPEVDTEVSYVKMQEGIYTISSGLDRSKAIDIPSASVSNGIKPIIFNSNGKWNQKFYIRPESEDTYVIMSANSGKVLEVNGSSIIQNVYTGAKTQQWRFVENTDGSRLIQSVSSGMVMDVTGGRSENGTKIGIYRLTRKTRQKFYLSIETGQSVHEAADGIYLMETSLKEDKVLTPNQEKQSIEISALKDGDTQKYRLESMENGCYKIISMADQKILTAGNDRQVLLMEENDAPISQQWILKKSGNQIYSVFSAKDGKCLDVSGGYLSDGTAIIKYQCNGNINQQFRLYEVQLGEELFKDGIYRIHSALDDTKVIEVYGGSEKSDANVQLNASTGKEWQKFEVKRLENGNYRIRSCNSGMAITVKDGKDANGANVYQYFPTGGEYQEWQIIPVGKGYCKLVSALGERVLDVSGGKAKNQANLIIYGENRKDNQKFRFEWVGECENPETEEKVLADGTYTIHTSLDESKVLDVVSGSLYSGANIILFTGKKVVNQQFVFQRDSQSGFYTITSKNSGMKMTYQNGILQNGTNVHQDNLPGTTGSQWKLKHIIGDYYTLYAADSSFCLDVTARRTANGTNLEIFKDNKGKAQIFRLEKVSGQTSVQQKTDLVLKDGVYHISSGLNSKMVLDVVSASKEDGANILLFQNNGGVNQKFAVNRLENGNYTIKALCSGKVLTAEGANVCQKTDEGLLSQQWEFIYAGNGYYTLKNAGSDKVMDLTGGKSENKTNVGIFTSKHTAWQRFQFIPAATKATAEFVTDGENDITLHYEMYAKGNETSEDDNYYLMQTDCYSGKIYGSPLAAVEKNYEIAIDVSGLEKSKLKETAMDKLVLAVKLSDGTYKVVTDPVSISNPEALAQNTNAIFKASSKKGLQGVAYASDGSQPVDARYTNSKQTMFNLDLADIVNPKSDYTTFIYKGKQYRFSKCSALIANIRSLNAGYQQYLYGNNGTTKASVSLCLLLSYDSENSYLIDPSARQAGHSYYLLNVREQKARETLEAAFVYLGEIFGQEDCYVTNWILGNEINSSRAWNYGGSLNFDTYMQCYTTAFRMLYNAVKSEKTGNTVSISLDNGWTAVPDTYAGKATLDTFAKKINAENPELEWSISYHAYSYPLTRADFWNDSSNTTNSTSTRYISMQNINVLTDYAASLEKSYQKSTGSIRVLITELGFSYGAGAENQARAIARGYYLAEFNNRIDAFIIRAIVDDAEEARGKLYFGLMNSQQEKRIAFYVYEYMDSDLNQLRNTSPSGIVSSANYGKFNSAKNILCNTNWKSVVPGFDASKLAGIK